MKKTLEIQKIKDLKLEICKLVFNLSEHSITVEKRDCKKSYVSIQNILQKLSMVESKGFINNLNINELPFIKKVCKIFYF